MLIPFSVEFCIIHTYNYRYTFDLVKSTTLELHSNRVSLSKWCDIYINLNVLSGSRGKKSNRIFQIKVLWLKRKKKKERMYNEALEVSHSWK